MLTALIVFLWIAFVYGIGVAIGFFWKPELPTILVGIFWGPIRLENEQGNSAFTTNTGLSVKFFLRPRQLFLDEEKYYVSHIQYSCRWWYMLSWPMILNFCFWQPRFQKMLPDPNDLHKLDRVPGSEIAFYGRLPGWRKQRPGYILTKGYPPFGHLD